MSLYENDSPTSLKIANYFFEVGLTDENLTKQFVKQLNEESMNNRKKLKRLLSTANPEALIENREFFQNYKRNDNLGSITESLNSMSTNDGSVAVNSLMSLYHSDESLENHKISDKDFLDSPAPNPDNTKVNTDVVDNSEQSDLNEQNSKTTNTVNFEENDVEKKPQSALPSEDSTNEINKKNGSQTHIVKNRSISRSSLSMHSITKKVSSSNTLDSLNLCVDDKEEDKISPEILETNHEPLSSKELSFVPDKGNLKLKSVNSMPLISSKSLKKSLSKAVLVHEFDDDAPLAYLKISLSKDNLCVPQQQQSSQPQPQPKQQELLQPQPKQQELLQPQLQQPKQQPKANAIHPIETKYSSKLLLRYPETDYNDNEKLTPHINMFCFPNDITLKYSLKKPYSTYHSFINTSLIGEKSYGVCVIIYEKIKGNVKKSYEELLNKWINENIDDNEKEYILHIHQELEKQQDELEKTKLKLKEILYKNDYVTQEDLVEHDDLSRNLNEISENIKLYEEILNTLGNKRFISADNVYQPKGIGVTSSWPWYNILKDWLSIVVRETVGGFGNKICIPFERYLINILNEIPFPPPGKYEISISTSEKILYFSQPPRNEIPLINNFSFYPTFRCLSHNNIIAVTEMLLGERKIIFVSSYAALLTNVIETFCSLIYPFEWKYNLIPVLPVDLLQYTHAPGPYIIGVLREYIDQMKEDLNEEACIIDIDNDTIEYGKNIDYLTGKEIESPKIPLKEKKRLLLKLNKYAIAGIQDDIIITKNNIGNGKPLGVPKFIVYTYPNGDFISSSRSKIDNDSVIQKTKTQSCSNSTNGSTNSTINKKTGAMIQNEIEINIINSNNDISRLPFELFSKKRISDVKAQGDANQSDSSFGDDNINYENTNKLKKKDSMMSRSYSAANLLNSNNTKHSRDNSATASNSEYLNPNRKNQKSNTLPHNVVTTANSITTFSERIGSKKRDGHIFKEFIPDANNFITIDNPSNLGLSNYDLDSQSEARNYVVIPNPNSTSNNGKYHDKSFLYKNTCDICEKYLFNSNMKILKCTCCSSIIHISCLSKISNFPCVSSFNQPKIQKAFVKVFRNIFKNYRKYIIPSNKENNDTSTSTPVQQDANNQLEWFNTTGFIKEAEKSHQEFLMLFKDTQAFAQFTLERAEKPTTDRSIQYFDELINYKKEIKIIFKRFTYFLY